MLRAADVTFSYHALGTPVLRGVSLDVPAGGFVGILGPNGSGKTTLLRVLAGTRQPSSGQVTLDGVDLSRVSRTRDGAADGGRAAGDAPGVRLHRARSRPDGTVSAPGRVRDRGPARHRHRARGARRHRHRALEDRLFATLSGGEKQRVIIAAALAQISAGESRSRRRPILLLDEPTAALDLAYQLEVAALLRDLQRRTPIAIVVSTHDLNFAAGLCRTLVLSEGRTRARRRADGRTC